MLYSDPFMSIEKPFALERQRRPETPDSIPSRSRSRSFAVVLLGLSLFASLIPLTTGLSFQRKAGLKAQESPPESDLGKACPANRIRNGAFESGFKARGQIDSVVGLHWTAFRNSAGGDAGGKLSFQPSTKLDASASSASLSHLAAREGAWSQSIEGLEPLQETGLWQVADLPRGSEVQVSAWAHAWASSVNAPQASNPPGMVMLRLGADPLGGQDPAAASIQWTEPISLTDAWIPLSLEVEALTDRLSVFLSAQLLDGLPYSRVLWDAVCMQVPEEASRAAERDRIETERFERTLAEVPLINAGQGAEGPESENDDLDSDDSGIEVELDVEPSPTPNLATIESMLAASVRATSRSISLQIHATQRAQNPLSKAGKSRRYLGMSSDNLPAVSGPSPARHFDLDSSLETRATWTELFYDKIGLFFLSLLALGLGLQIGFSRSKGTSEGSEI